MRPGPLAAIAVVCACLGGLAVVAVEREAGWLRSDGGTTTVVYDRTRSTESLPAPAAVRAAARPLVGNGFDPAQIYAARSPGVVTIFAYFGGSSGEVAQGSGFVVSADGAVLTNSHVITNAGETSADSVHAARRVYVEFSDRDRVSAKVVGWDVFDDVGVLRIEPSAHALQPVPLGRSSTVVVGQPVAAIGSPFGNENSLAVGVVSGRRAIDSLTSRYAVVDALQTDAPITHGNSGGPLFDARGRVIGINVQIQSQSGGGNEAGVGFAIPIDAAGRSLRQLLTRRRVAYGFVGISTEDLTPSLAERFGYPATHGAVITNVSGGSPAAKAGLRGGTRDERVEELTFRRGGDLIVAIDGKPVLSGDDVVRLVSASDPGDVARFTVYRGGSRRTVSVRLEERPVTP